MTTIVSKSIADKQAVELPEITQQFAHLSTREWQVISIIAAARVPLQLGQLATIVRERPRRLLNMLRSLPGLWLTDSPLTVEFAHDLVQSQLHDSIDEELRRQCHRLLAEYYERQPDCLGLAAEHWTAAGNQLRTVEIALAAAEIAETNQDVVAAAHLFGLATSAMNESAEKTEILARLANLLVSAGFHAKAIPVLEKLAASHDGCESLEWKWKLLTCRLAVQDTDGDELFRDAQALESIADRWGHDDALYHSLRIQNVIVARKIADHSLVRERLRLEALSGSRPLTPIGVSALRHIADHTTLTEDAEKGLSFARQACEWADKLAQPELRLNCLHSLALSQYCCGQVEEARQTLYSALQLADSCGAASYRSLIMSTLCCALIELDARVEAEQCLKSIKAGQGIRDEIDRLTADANMSVFLYHYGEYVQCIAAADHMLAANTSGSWLEISIRGVRGLSLLETGRVQEATTDSDWLERTVRSIGVLAGDLSYAIMLIARVATLRRNEKRIEPLVIQKYEEYSKRDYICRQRIRLALAEVTMRRAPEQALLLAEEVAGDAEARHLSALYEQACRTVRRARRKHGMQGARARPAEVK
jgi:hypothetical protein